MNLMLIGASGGIGSELSNAFPEHVVIKHFNTLIPKDNGWYRCDISEFDSTQNMVGDILSKFGLLYPRFKFFVREDRHLVNKVWISFFLYKS